MPRLLHRSPAPPLGPFTLNRDSVQAQNLVFWAPPLASRGQSGLLDLSGPGYPGAASGDAAVQSDPLMGAALALDGTGDYVSFGDIDSLEGFAQATICQWVYLNASQSLKSPISKYNDSNSLGWMVETNATDRLLLAPTPTQFGQTADGAFPAQAWIHYAFWFDGTGTGNAGRLKLYLYGAPVSLNYTGTIPTTMAAVAHTLRIGADAGNARALNGRVGDTRIYNRALSPQEIWQLYAAQTRWELYRPVKWRTIVSAPAGGGNVTVTPGAVALALSQPAVVPMIQVLPGAVAETIAAPAATSVVSPIPAAVALALAAPAAIPVVQPLPGVVALSLAEPVPTPVLQALPPAVPLVLALPTPTIQTGSGVTVSPNPIALSLALPAPTPVVQAMPGPVALALLALVVASPAIKATPGVVALLLAALAPTVTGPGQVTVTPAAIALAVQALAAKPTLQVQPSTVALILQVLALAVGQQAARATPTNRGQAVAGPTDRSY